MPVGGHPATIDASSSARMECLFIPDERTDACYPSGSFAGMVSANRVLSISDGA
jgi:hypothetical protein